MDNNEDGVKEEGEKNAEENSEDAMKGKADENNEISTFVADAQKTKVQSVLDLSDAGGDNILHMCSTSGQNKLLFDICTSEKLSDVNIETALMAKNSKGRSALDLCRDEETILKILDRFDIVAHLKQNGNKMNSL